VVLLLCPTSFTRQNPKEKRKGGRASREGVEREERGRKGRGKFEHTYLRGGMKKKKKKKKNSGKDRRRKEKREEEKKRRVRKRG